MTNNPIIIPVNLNLNVRGLKTSATLAINETCKKLQEAGKEVFKLGLGQSPFPVPEIVVEALRQNAHQKDLWPVNHSPQLLHPFNMQQLLLSARITKLTFTLSMFAAFLAPLLNT